MRNSGGRSFLGGGGGSGGGPGTPGAPGPSAYEIAVDNGFVGSEADWLASLQGPGGTAVVQVVTGDEPPDIESYGEGVTVIWADTSG